MRKLETVKCKCRHGDFEVLKHDKYIGQALAVYGEYCEGEVDLFRQLVTPGTLVLDVGANVGAFTVPLSQFVGDAGRVLAFEPQHVIFELLCANCRDLGNVVAYEAALGAAGGSTFLPRVDYNRDGNFGAVAVGASEGDSVPVITVDDLELPACHFIKIDAEGSERDVLSGAEKTIGKFRPVLYVENDRREKSEALIRWLQAREYQLVWYATNLFNPDNYNRKVNDLWPGTVSVNVLGVPAEYHVELTGFTPVKDANVWRVLRGGKDD